MSLSNFQDVVVLSSDTLNAGIERFAIGSSAGSKSIVFAQDVALASVMHLVASNPTAQRTAILPDANGTIGYLTNISAGTTAVTNGQIVFSNSNEFVFGINVSTFTAGLTTISDLEIGLYVATTALAQSSFSSTASSTNTLHTTTFSSGIVSGVRISIPYPINITYIDPCGQRVLSVSGSGRSVSCSASLTWWCGIYTINGSTAGVVSSVSSSASTSGSASSTMTQSININGRFTNITWNVTPGDYMFFTGHTVSGSFSWSGTSNNMAVNAGYVLSAAGARCPEVSYSIPYWDNGSISQSATSFHLTNLSNSGGTGSSTFSPYVRFIGS